MVWVFGWLVQSGLGEPLDHIGWEGQEEYMLSWKGKDFSGKVCCDKMITFLEVVKVFKLWNGGRIYRVVISKLE